MEKGASEIVKLTERIAKDPKSKLFVPLAEEYKKIGDIEMAINVLQEGLKNNPGYITARSFLGRLLMESGDLNSAQKELEEVIKAIPDNLLAQRKLGDLYILQGRNGDALQRYKTALVLNPGDKEVTSLVADLDAGKDISGRIPKPKVTAQPTIPPRPEAKPSLAQQIQKTVPPSGAVPRPAAATVPAPPKASPAPEPAIARSAPPQQPKGMPQAPVLQKQASPSVPPAPEETEIVEEIVELEPLEHPSQTQEMPTPTATHHAAPEPEAGEGVFDLSEGSAFDLSEPSAGPLPADLQQDAVSWEPPALEVPQEIPPASQEGAADDINTNTLAELYITQGFYEKAIEIYQGMLAERPGNRALEQKLEKIRAMAGVAEQNASFMAPSGPPEDLSPRTDIFAGARMQPGAGTAVPPAAAAVPAPAAQASKEVAPAVERAERREPPQAAPERAAEPQPLPGPQARRKETIDRLESWLKNVIKEKP